MLFPNPSDVHNRDFITQNRLEKIGFLLTDWLSAMKSFEQSRFMSPVAL